MTQGQHSGTILTDTDDTGIQFMYKTHTLVTQGQHTSTILTDTDDTGTTLRYNTHTH